MGSHRLLGLLLLVAAVSNTKSLLLRDSRSSLNEAGFQDELCPTWFHRSNISGDCECGKNISNLVNCSEKSELVQLLTCNCITYEHDAGMSNWTSAVVGHCMLGCIHNVHPNTLLLQYLPQDVPHLFNYTCGRFNRDGRLCGACREGYSLPLYSHSLACVQCSRDTAIWDWIKFILVAFLPLTVFFVFLIAFRVNVAAPPWSCFVIVCQLLADSRQIALLPAVNNSLANKVIRIVFSFYGIWNLDFFRTLYKPFCAYSGGSMGTLEHLALEYAIAFFPLVLIVAAYMVVILHDHGLFSYLARPFSKCSKCNMKCFIWSKSQLECFDFKNSLIIGFSSFLLLSSHKLLDISYNLLTPVVVYDMDGEQLDHSYLFCNANIEYFGAQHAKYAIPAVFVILVFIILPLLLLLIYPCKCFQKCLVCNHRFSIRLKVFMDAFQGCYKTRVDSKFDRRWFSSMYLVVPLLCIMVTLLTSLSPVTHLVLANMLICATMLVAIAQPYREQKYTIINIVLFLVLSSFYIMAYVTFTATDQTLLPRRFHLMIAMFMLFLMPLVLFIGYVAYCFIVHKKLHLWILRKLRKTVTNENARYTDFNTLSRGPSTDVPGRMFIDDLNYGSVNAEGSLVVSRELEDLHSSYDNI